LASNNCLNCSVGNNLVAFFNCSPYGVAIASMETAMTRAQSPAYPSISLSKAISLVRKIHEADRRNPIDRAVAAKHIGYGGLSGASDKTLASIAHYGLTEKTGKGEIRVSQLALDILHPNKPSERTDGLLRAAYKPQVFKDIRERFSDGRVSAEALRSYLIRENFLDRAISPVINSYMDNCRFLEQEKVDVSGGQREESSSESETPDDDESVVFGGAKVGDLIQWEVNGALQMEKPMRVRFVTDDGKWIAVDGSETGIPMDQVTVVERSAPTTTLPPRFKIPEAQQTVETGETEWMRSLVGRETKVRLLVSGGEMGPKEIGKLIKLLQAQQAVLTDDEEIPEN
jgi:hypothetical protein